MTSPGSSGPQFPAVARERWVARLRTTLTGHTSAVRAVSWGRLENPPLLASAGDDGTVRLWDPERGTELAALTGHTGPVSAVAWGRLDNPSVIASGGDDGTVRLWDPVIELVHDRLPRYRSDDPGDPDRLNRDAEAAALAEMSYVRESGVPTGLVMGVA
jgi:WD40 repeat protein